MRGMLQRLLGENIELILKPQPWLGRVKVDPGQIEQVLLNLALNARDAMDNGGALTLETSDIDAGEELAGEGLDAPDGDYVKLRVSDTGSGMDAYTRKHLFEPFFTTKGPGKGTGLGLATVYGMVKQSGGELKVESELGRGTAVSIYLPRTQAHEPAVVDRKAEEVAGPTLLLVEDEDAVRRSLAEELQQRGYRVLQANNGQQALLCCREFQGEIKLVITDLVMPVMGGRELAERLKRIRPETLVLFISGYSDEADALPEGLLFRKPFTGRRLGERVRDLLAEAGSEEKKLKC